MKAKTLLLIGGGQKPRKLHYIIYEWPLLLYQRTLTLVTLIDQEYSQTLYLCKSKVSKNLNNSFGFFFTFSNIISVQVLVDVLPKVLV